MKVQKFTPLFTWLTIQKMYNHSQKNKWEKVEFCGEYGDRNNRCWGFPEYMEEYRLSRGYEWRNGKLQEKIDPRCLNYHGIPTNNYNLPAVPGLNMLPLNARVATNNRYLSQIIVKWACMVKWTTSGAAIKRSSPHLKLEYMYDDLSFLEGFKMNPTPMNKDDILSVVQDRKSAIFGKPPVLVKDWNVIINKNWTYIVQFYADIIYSDPRDTLRLDKEYLRLLCNWRVWARVQQRSCSNLDWILWLYIWSFNKWDKLNIACWLGFVDNNIKDTYFATAINITETS